MSFRNQDTEMREDAKDYRAKATASLNPCIPYPDVLVNVIVRCFFGDLHVMHMRLANTG